MASKNRLTLIKDDVGRSRGAVLSRYRCECGKVIERSRANVSGNFLLSCGCAKQPHGLARTPEYRAWACMMRRCYKPITASYKHYGGRGIAVCKRWHKMTNFVKDMGPRPSDNHSLERIDNEGNYSPVNCRWATTAEQGRNRRTTRFLTYKNITLSMVEWCEKLNLDYGIVKARITRLKWNADRALSTPTTGGYVERSKG